MSTLLFWQGRGGRNGPAAGGAQAQGSAGRAWLHAPDLLLKGHVAYLVKFLGSTTVDQPKGIEVVKDAIRRLQFSQQLRKSETGAKSRKVEITISVDGVAIQEPRTNNILHQFPLHRISYCADDKEAKKYFSFIAKGDTTTTPNGDVGHGTTPSLATTNGSSANEQHECFVFVSNKLASEITLTIGQAFDLAYRRFLMERGAGAEAVGLEASRARAQATEMAARARELASLLPAGELKAWLSKKGISHATEWNPEPDFGLDTKSSTGSTQDNLLPSSPPVYSNNNHIVDLMNTSIDMSTPTKNPSVGTKLEGLLLNSDSDSDFDPRALETEPPAVTIASRPRIQQPASPSQNGLTPPPLLAPPPKANKRSPPQNNLNGSSLSNGSSSDLFGSTPFALPPPTHAAPTLVTPSSQLSNSSINTSINTPNYNLSDFNAQMSIFPPANTAAPLQSSNNSFTNGMVGFDPFDTGKFGVMNGNNYNGISNGFSNPMGNGFSAGNISNGFGNTFPFGEKQNSSAALDSSFSGFLDKRVSEMKDGFSRGLVIANEDFLIESLDPFRKN